MKEVHTEYKKERRPTQAMNAKFANRRNPYEVRSPDKKQNDNWLKKYDHLTFTCSRGMKGIRQSEKKPRAKWEREGNFFHLMQAFYMRVDELTMDREERRKGLDEASLVLIDEIKPEENEILIPLWMASVIADGFKQYISRRLFHEDHKVTLDAVFRVDNKKFWDEFDTFTIDNYTILNKTREMQWYFGFAFSKALEFAQRIIEAECKCNGQELFRFDHADLQRKEMRGELPSLGAWLKEEGLGEKASDIQRNDYLAFLDSLDPSFRQDIETAKMDKRVLLKSPS